MGRHAFAHKAGMHAAGVSADSATFEHVEPGLVGNRSDVIVSELAGRATVAEKGEQAGL
ncbi:MAG: citramalate synthase, partial [Solirubrobacterales bacterium]